MKKSNKDLQEFYESIYQKGEESYFSKFSGGGNSSENDEVVLSVISQFKGKTFLDVGCGTGSLVHSIGEQGAEKAIGIDYSPSAIDTANEKHVDEAIEFQVFDFNKWEQKMDYIISCGTVEHMDRPVDMIKRAASILNEGGELILTCPHFYNLKGIVWISLQKLFDVPMSLTDLHSISPADMKNWADECGLQLEQIIPFDYHRANGPEMVVDLKKRLTNALADAGMDNSKVDEMLSWFNDFIEYIQSSGNIKLDGANCLYRFKKA